MEMKLSRAVQVFLQIFTPHFVLRSAMVLQGVLCYGHDPRLTEQAQEGPGQSISKVVYAQSR